MSNKYRLVKPYISHIEHIEPNILSGGKQCFYELMNMNDFQEGYFTVKNEIDNTEHNFYGVSKKKLYDQHGGNSIDLSMNRQNNDFYLRLSEIAKNLNVSLDSLNKLIEQELRRASTEPLILELKQQIQDLTKRIERDKNDSSCIIM